MELSTEILETLGMNNKDVIEVLKNGKIAENIVFESEVTEEDDGEEEEIEEIIEIIEEVEECDEAATDDYDASKDKALNDNETIERVMKTDLNKKDFYSFSEEDSMFSSQPVTQESAKAISHNTHKIMKQVINYDVDEDWQDEELERNDEFENSELIDNHAASLQTTKKLVNNQTVTLQSNKVDPRLHVAGRSEKPRTESGIGNDVNVESSGETTHEIVKNVENNLLYTVLGTKKQDPLKQAQQDAQYVKVSVSQTFIRCTIP